MAVSHKDNIKITIIIESEGYHEANKTFTVSKKMDMYSQFDSEMEVDCFADDIESLLVETYEQTNAQLAEVLSEPQTAESSSGKKQRHS